LNGGLGSGKGGLKTKVRPNKHFNPTCYRCVFQPNLACKATFKWGALCLPAGGLNAALGVSIFIPKWQKYQMSNENYLVIKPELDLTTSQNPDTAISKINKAFNKLYDERRQRIINLLRQMPSLLDLANKLAEGKSYRAVISPEVLKKIRSGAVSWDKSTDGFYGAIIRDNETGQIVAHVKLEEISPEMLTSINQLAVQHTLAEIVQRLEIVDQKITNVLEGQRNDRLALIESGINLYQQAIAASNSETRHRLLINAIDKLDEGRQKLILSLENDIGFIDKIPRTFWQMLFYAPLRDVSEEVESKAKPVQQSFQAILRASYVLASVYEALGEIQSLQVSLQPLRDTILKFGEKGKQIARLLPYDPISPPEELWHSSLLQLADGITRTDEQFEIITSKVIEFPFEVNEIRYNEDGGTNL
jgi:hypothetical protein